MVNTPGIGNAMAVAYQGDRSESQHLEVKVNEVQPKAAPPATSSSSDEQRGGSGGDSSSRDGRGGHVDVRA